MIKEVKIGVEEFQELKNFLICEGVGEIPLAIFFSSELKESRSLADLISVLELVVDQIGIDPRFPFPLYIIDPEFKMHSKRIQILNSYDEIPKHIRTFNHLNRESDFLWERKKNIVISKFKKNNVDKMYQKINGQKGTQKELQQEMHLYTYYSNLLLLLQKDEKRKTL